MRPVEVWMRVSFKSTGVSLLSDTLGSYRKEPSSHLPVGREGEREGGRNGAQAECTELEYEGLRAQSWSLEAQRTEADGWFEMSLEKTRVLVEDCPGHHQ